MKFLLVSNNFPVSTQDFAAAFAFSFVKELFRLGHRVTVVTLSRNTDWQENQGFEVIRISGRGTQGKNGGFRLASPLFLFHYLMLDFKAKRAIGELLQKNSYDMGLALWAEPSGRWLAWANRRFGLPFIVWCLGSDIRMTKFLPIYKNVVRSTLRSASVLFADGFSLAEDVRKLSQKECSFLATSRPLPPVKRIHNTDFENKQIFIFIGRLEFVKGVDILIKAFAAARIVGAVLLIFGMGSMESTCRRLINNLEAERDIILLGYAEPDVFQTYLMKAQCCVVPSRAESIPVVLSEALQCGCPLLVTRAGDMGTIVDRFRVGLVVPKNDIGSLALGLREMAVRKREAFSEDMGKAAQFFSISKTVSQFIMVAEKAK